MTGFGRAAGGRRGRRVLCEVRSVNHRYLTVKLRLPESLARLEPWIDQRVRRDLSRGSVQLRVTLRAPGELSASRLDPRAADAYLEQLRPFLRKRGLSEQLAPEALLPLPGVLVPPDPEDVAAELRPQVEEVVGKALDQLVRMRRREGARLATALRREARDVAAGVRRMAARSPGVVKDYQRRLRTRVRSLLEGSGTSLDPAVLAREVALFADRCDVTEEFDRLRSHLQELERLLGSKEPVGRALEFLVQEMGREVQTVGSKTQDTRLVREVLRAKASLERLREQVQNVE